MRANPDGYTILIGPWAARVSISFNPTSLQARCHFAPIGLSSSTFADRAAADFPPNNLREFVSYVRANAILNMHMRYWVKRIQFRLMLNSVIGAKPTSSRSPAPDLRNAMMGVR